MSNDWKNDHTVYRSGLSPVSPEAEKEVKALIAAHDFGRAPSVVLVPFDFSDTATYKLKA